MKRTAVFLLILMLAVTGCSSSASQGSGDAGKPTASAENENTASIPSNENETPVTPAPENDPEAAVGDTIYVSSMDTEMALTAYGSHRAEALKAAQEEILRLNDLLSVGVETSDIARANRDGEVVMAEDTEALVRASLDLYDKTGGLFDITIYPLMDLWGFTTKRYYIPSDREIEAALDLVGSDRLSFSENDHTLTLGAGQAIDLGAIAKGYTSARIMEIFREHGVVSAMVSLGGNVQCLGTKPDGSAWRIGIQDPVSARGETVAKLHITDEAVITSGSYERYFADEESGEIYHHIIDPRTGRSANSGLTSVTVVCRDGALADGLSTSLFIMGMDVAFRFWQSGVYDFEALFIDDAGKIYITPGLGEMIYDTPGVTVLE